MKFAGHFAFDIFLKNSSRADKDIDELQLNYDSSVKIMANEEGTDKSGTGLQNTVRVAFAKFGGTKDAGGNYTGVSDVNAPQATILKETGAATDGDAVYITDVAIWEPNSSDHVEYIVTNNNRITWAATDTIDPSQTLANGKTGFTDEAGDCLASTASNDDLKLIAVVLNGDTPATRFSDSVKLYNYGFANFKREKVLNKYQIIDDIKVMGGKENKVSIALEDDCYVLLNKGDKLKKKVEENHTIFPYGIYKTACGFMEVERQNP